MVSVLTALWAFRRVGIAPFAPRRLCLDISFAKYTQLSRSLSACECAACYDSPNSASAFRTAEVASETICGVWRIIHVYCGMTLEIVASRQVGHERPWLAFAFLRAGHGHFKRVGVQ